MKLVNGRFVAGNRGISHNQFYRERDGSSFFTDGSGHRLTTQKYVCFYRNIEGGKLIKRGVKHEFWRILPEKIIQVKRISTRSGKKLNLFPSIIA
jgi:hypothetical protein